MASNTSTRMFDSLGNDLLQISQPLDQLDSFPSLMDADRPTGQSEHWLSRAQAALVTSGGSEAGAQGGHEPQQSPDFLSADEEHAFSSLAGDFLKPHSAASTPPLSDFSSLFAGKDQSDLSGLLGDVMKLSGVATSETDGHHDSQDKQDKNEHQDSRDEGSPSQPGSDDDGPQQGDSQSVTSAAPSDEHGGKELSDCAKPQGATPVSAGNSIDEHKDDQHTSDAVQQVASTTVEHDDDQDAQASQPQSGGDDDGPGHVDDDGPGHVDDDGPDSGGDDDETAGHDDDGADTSGKTDSHNAADSSVCMADTHAMLEHPAVPQHHADWFFT